MNDEILRDVEERVDAISPHKRMWVLPILLCIDELGGSAKPKDVRSKVRESFRDHLLDEQWEHLLRTQRLGWARWDMRKAGLISDVTRVWAMTDDAKVYLDAHRDDPIELQLNLPDNRDGSDGDGDEIAMETVTVTVFEAYDIPLLRILADGVGRKSEIKKEFYSRFKSVLAPGDFRLMTRGRVVWHFRMSWALSNLKADGEARNPSRGTWEITDTGQARLEKENESWRIDLFQSSEAKVLLNLPDDPSPEPPGVKKKLVGDGDQEDGEWSIGVWEDLKNRIDHRLFEQLSARLQLGKGTAARVPRNVILYGPPGTGKTHVAKLVGRALTGDDEPTEDGRFQMVQFHPSYCYEDFVQGLKPDLETKELRYKRHIGPFLEICAAANDESDRFFLLLIDEINRGDPARIFGELMYALEYRGEVVRLATGGSLIVPPNLIIVGTMNSVDRSVALVDYALRRRFGFIRVDPDPEVVASVLGESTETGRVAAGVLEEFNKWLVQRLDREHVLGHSFFLSSKGATEPKQALNRVWQMDVEPLLDEYLFGNADALREAKQEWDRILKSALEELKEDADAGTEDAQ